MAHSAIYEPVINTDCKVRKHLKPGRKNSKHAWDKLQREPGLVSYGKKKLLQWHMPRRSQGVDVMPHFLGSGWV